MFHRFTFLMILFLTSQIGTAADDLDPLQKYVYLLNNKSMYKHTNIGVAVHDVASQKFITGYNESKTFIPASSLKLLSSLIILEELGSDYRYETLLAYDGEILKDGTLNGNLYIIGSGDPSLGSDRFPSKPNLIQLLKDIALEIKDLGIKCIDGEIITDESVFDAFPVAPSWQWNDLGNYYAGGTWGVNIAENEYKIYYNSNRPINSIAKLLYTDPKVPGLSLSNEVTVDSANTEDNAYIFGGPYNYQKRIVGTIPFDKQPFRIKGSLPDPPKFLAYYVEKELNQIDIETHGHSVQVRDKRNDKKRTTFDTLYSVNLQDLVQAANYNSINLYCESFLKTIGQKMWKESSGSAGISYIRKYLKTNKVDDGALFMHDGSGLSARNLVSPALLSEFLASYANKNGIELVQDVLPKTGAEGTVKGMLHGYGANGKVWMKSGSMDQVQSYTGICKAKSGKWISFCIIFNGFGEKHKVIRPDIEKLIENIYRYN